MTKADLRLAHEDHEPVSTPDEFRAAFFNCRFLYAADELSGDEACAVYEDEGSDRFFHTLVRICRGGPTSKIMSLDALAQFEGPVFVEAPVWHRCCRQLAGIGVSGERLRVFLYSENNPSGFWDFAKACGPNLADLFRTGRLNDASLAALSPFLENWMAGRRQGNRLTIDSGFATRDFANLIADNGAKISQVLSKLADDTSRAHYARIVYGGAEDIFRAFCANLFGKQQYMDIVEIRPGDVIANFGVADGWELPYFLCRMRGRGQIHNFDPNIAYSESGYGPFIDEFADMVRNHPIIVTDRDGTMTLTTSDSGMIRSADAPVEGETAVYAARSLDSLVAEGVLDRVDYMKMDVEGGEIHILKGALETIRRQRPKLAVAIYHEPEHLWDYPLRLMDTLEDYRFYVRQYGYSRFETVLYAVPMEAAASRSGEEGLSPAAPDPSRVTEGLVGFYTFDQTPRTYYQGPRRITTRFFGAAWDLGELSGAPRIEADRLCAVFEDGARRLFVTRHKFFGGQTSLVAGVAASATAVDWTATVGVDEATICVPVANFAAGAAVIAYDAARRRATLAIVTPESISWRLEFACAEEPVIGVFDRDDGGFSVVTVSVDRRSLSQRRYNREGAGLGAAASVRLPQPFRGVVLHKRFVDGQPEHAFAFALGEAECSQVELVRFDAAGLSPLGALDVGQGVDIIPLVPSIGAPGP